MNDHNRLRHTARNVCLSQDASLAITWQEMAAELAGRARQAVDDGRHADATELQTWAAIYAEWARLCADTDEDHYLAHGRVVRRVTFREGLLRISMPIWTGPVLAHLMYPEPVRPVVDAHGRVVEVPVAGLFQGFPGTAFADEDA